MAYVTFSFLVQFPSRIEGHQRNKSKGSLSAVISDLGELKDTIDPKYLVLPSKHKNYCHIYYLITPFRVIHVSIVELDDVALIGTKERKAAVRTLKLSGGTWVAFSVVHKLPMPRDAIEIQGWHGHKIEFQVSQEAKDILPEVLSDKTKYFLSMKAARNSENFFEELKRFDNDEFVCSNYKESLKLLAESKVEQDDVSVVLEPIPSEVHLNAIARRLGENEISVLSDGNLEVKRQTNSGPARKIPQQQKKGCIQKRSKKNTSDSLLFTGQQLLYDKRTWKLEKYRITKDIQTFGLWSYSTNLLSESIRKELIPLGIHVQKLKNLPEELTSDSRLTISYSLNGIIENVQIKAKQLYEDHAVFDDAKLFFLNKFSLETIFSSLQTTPLILKISATRKREGPKNRIDPSSYSFGYNFDMLSSMIVHKPPGDEVIEDLRKNFAGVIHEKPKKDQGGGARGGGGGAKNNAGARQKKSEEEVFLGYVAVDCSSLAAGNFRLNVDSPVSRYNHFQALESNAILEHFDALRVHEIATPGETGIIEEGKFVSSEIYLKVKLQISGLPPLDSPEMEGALNDTIRRVIVITHDFKPLKRIVKVKRRIVKLNSDVVKNKNYIYPWKPYWHIRKAGQLTLPENYPSILCTLTGFVVRMPSMNVLVAEGIGGLSFPGAFDDIFSLPTKDGRVIYNSKIIFLERLYNDFLPFGGIFTINMKTSATEIIARMRKSLLTKNCPSHALKALIKLDSLVQCSEIQYASVKNYFPSVQELVSFEHEFGIPVLKKCKDSPLNGIKS